MHACALAEELGMRSVLVPRVAGVLSALGLAIADIRRDYVGPLFSEVAALDPARLTAAWEALAERARKDLRGLATEPDLDRLADLRYQGQSYELTVAGDTPAALAEAFHVAHQRRYGHREDDEPVEVVNVRLVATVPGPRPDVIEPEPSEADLRTGYRDVLLNGTWVKADVLDRGLMGRGSTARAPAVVEFAEATCVVRPGWTGTIDSAGTLILTRGD
jgi:N-methylhydantoinase A